jgi:hypothetical protein
VGGPAGRGRRDRLTALWCEDIAAVVDRVERPLVVELADALAWPAGNVGRSFDLRWLGASTGRFELVAVVNRLDRQDLAPGTCGEVRLLYRLAYTTPTDTGPVGSRLPFLVNAVFVPTLTDCAAVARRWVRPPGDVAAWLVGPDGPLADVALDRIEVNAQVVRFPSGVETEFAGQAAYLLRVYDVDGDGFSRAPLENVPDVRRIAADPALRARLLSFLTAELPAIDAGNFQIPVDLLTDEAVSWSTLGANRLANKPFDALFPVGPRDELPSPVGPTVRGRDGLVERLNDATCMGCHQSGSMAGFHVLGLDDPERTGVTNRLRVPFSPHYGAERGRRAAYVAAVASGIEPDRRRPHSLSRPIVGRNAPCLTPERASELAFDAVCPDGLGCEEVAVDPRVGLRFGQCVAPTLEAAVAGDTCRTGLVTAADAGSEGPFNGRSDRDTLQTSLRYAMPEDKQFDASHLNCRPTVIGVPLGRAYRSCTVEERRFDGLSDDSPLPDAICGLVGGSTFDRCVERDFHECLDRIVGRGMVAACDATHPCREDYVCQAFPTSMPGVDAERAAILDRRGVGFCTPTYFLFQIRLDGHPVPDG